MPEFTKGDKRMPPGWRPPGYKVPVRKPQSEHPSPSEGLKAFMPKTIRSILKELVFQSTVDADLAQAVNYYPALADIEKIMQGVIGQRPEGHHPDELCCDECELRDEQLKRLKEALEAERVQEDHNAS